MVKKDVSVSENDPTNKDLNAIQLGQNKLARILNGVRLTDNICTKPLLSNLKILSVNQINAQSKLLVMWKALNVERNPLKVTKNQMEQWLPGIF